MTKPKGVFKKRRNKGNQHYRTFPPVAPETVNIVNKNITTPSSSKKKLDDFELKYENIKVSSSNNIIIDFSILVNIVSEHLCCKLCGGGITLSEILDARNGLVCKLSIVCSTCQTNTQFWSSKKCNNNLYTTNVSFVYGMRCIGQGLTAGKTFCGILNLPSPPCNYAKYTKVIAISVKQIAADSMVAAAKEAIELNEGNGDISIAYDGIWQKRGYVSKNAVASVASIDSGKILDIEVLTKYCHGCTVAGTDADKVAKHKINCVKNYEGTSGGMEVEAAVKIFERSQIERGVRYINFLGDGDSKAFLAVAKSAPYGATEITKLECVGHVEKRMGTRLRKLKKEQGSVKLADNKTLKNKGRLTDKVIDQLQCYYGKAIRDNTNDLHAMVRAVWATYYHRKSTDEEPMHQLCSDWCKYKKAAAEGTLDGFSHKNSLPEAVMCAIKPIYRDLAHPQLLRKCLHGKTQNVNESFNNIVWTRIPKNVFVGRHILELGVCDSVITFNIGNVGRLGVLEHLGIQIGQNCVFILQGLDKERIRKAEIATQNISKEARTARRRKRLLQEEAVDDPDYKPGGF